MWPDLGGQSQAGEGQIVGVLDTGIWPEHPMLRDTGMPKPAGGPWACQFGDGTDPVLGAPFTCNNKLIGAYAFLDTNLAINGGAPGEYCDNTTDECSARDSDGHGTHTSTTAAGDRVAHANLLGVDRGPISGIAPGASVIMYRVCLVNGCYSSDSVAAVQQAIEDGVDVINFSIGGGANPYSDPVELAFLDAYAANINVNASAGNDGPGNATAEHARTVGHHRRRADVRPRVPVAARPHRGRRLAVQQDRERPSPRASPTSAVVLASNVAHYRDALCQDTVPGELGPQQGRRLRARGERPRRQGLQRAAGRGGGHDPLQPDPERRRDGQPLVAGDPPRRPERRAARLPDHAHRHHGDLGGRARRRSCAAT